MSQGEDVEALISASVERSGDEFSVLDLVAMVADRRGRPIRLVPWAMPDVSQFGVWLAGPKSDYIFFESDTARVHQHHIILHELAHILLGHRTVFVDESVAISDGLLMRTAARDTEEERAAESLAADMQAAIIEAVGLQALTSRISSSPVWSDLVYGLGYDRGR
jgi:hypothetical protein